MGGGLLKARPLLLKTSFMNKLIIILMCAGLSLTAAAQGQRHRSLNKPFVTDTPMVHDPVMAYEDSTYHIYATGMGIQHLTSQDRKSWTVQPSPVMSVIPKWTMDSVPGFRLHVWAPDVIKYHGKWWLAYSCSTFGKNGSAIGLLSNRSLSFPVWEDEGCIVTSREKRDNWNAIDPNFVIDENDMPWMVWGSFWDGIQLARLDTTMHIAKGEKPRTIARRYGAKSNYRVAVGRSQSVEGPYLDREGKDMLLGGGTLFLEGDKQAFEAAGHCAAYTFGDEDIFVCHGYSIAHKGASILVQRPIVWSSDGWPQLK